MASCARAVCLLLIVIALNAQTISVNTREVIVDVTVADARGIPVSGLTKADFTITDDGKPRTIDAFSAVSEYRPISGMQSRPLHLPPHEPPDTPVTGHSTAIILDEVNTYFEDAANTRLNALALLSKAPLDERIALYAIVRKRGLVLIQDYTVVREQLRRSLTGYRPSGMRPSEVFNLPKKPLDEVCVDAFGLSLPEVNGGDQLVPPWDSPLTIPTYKCQEIFAAWHSNAEDARLSLQALAGQLASFPGRKSLFWLSNAFPRWLIRGADQSAWDKTFAALNEANAAVNVVDSRGLQPGTNAGTGTIATMVQIADRTGGKAYFNRNDFDGAILEGIAAARANYSLRFHLPDDERDKRFHTLKVKVKRPRVDVFHRQGYYAGGGFQAGVDLVAGKVEGQAMDARASVAAPPLDASIQLPWFYTGTNRASVHLTVAMNSAPREPLEMVGVALRPDGTEVSRFADRIPAESGGRYEHPFTLPAGSYTFRLTVGTAATVIGRKEVPLVIEPWSSGSFGIGGIAFSTEVREARLPSNPGALIAAGKEFSPAADNRFEKSSPIYFYTEICDSANAAALTMQYRILDATTGEVRLESGVGGAASFVWPGDPVVRFATAVPLAQLQAGAYRLEVKAGHSSSTEVVTRIVEFEVNR